MGVLDAWARLGGRLHPLFLHFPIACALVACVAELWRGVTRQPLMASVTRPLIAVAAVAGVLAAGSGWLFAAYEGEEASRTLQLHRWSGTATALAMLGVWWLAWRAERQHNLIPRLRAALAVAALLVSGAGHFGGELVYGDGFVEKALASAINDTFGTSIGSDDEGGSEGGSRADGAGSRTAAVAEAAAAIDPGNVDFTRDIQPILDRNCVECHGTKKRKGGLSLTPITLALALEPDEPGHDRVIDPGHPERSELLARLLLPPDDEDAMPPDDGPLPTEEIALLHAWVLGGARVPAEKSAE